MNLILHAGGGGINNLPLKQTLKGAVIPILVCVNELIF